jgi:hypothetical protein
MSAADKSKEAEWLSDQIERLEEIREDISGLLEEVQHIFRQFERSENPCLQSISNRAHCYFIAELEIALSIEHRFLMRSSLSFEQAILDLKEELESL